MHVFGPVIRTLGHYYQGAMSELCQGLGSGSRRHCDTQVTLRDRMRDAE